MICHKRNLSAHILIRHSRSTPEARWHCPVCKENTFKSPASLRDHMSRKHKCYGAPRGPVASLRARSAGPPGPARIPAQVPPIEDIPSDSSEAGETKAIPGSPPLAGSQDPKKVTFGTIPVAEFQVDGTSTADEEERGQGRRQVRPRRPANREADRDAGLTGCNNCKRTGKAAG